MSIIGKWYKEFKQTEIGKIPKEWEVVRLKEICEMERGFSYRSDQITDEETEIEFITINNIKKEGGLKKTSGLYLRDSVEVDEKFYVNKNSLFIANTDMARGHIIGAPILIKDIEKRCVFSMDLTRLLLRSNNLLTSFFFYLLSHPKIRNFMKRNAQGTNVLHLNHQLVASLKLPLPPLPEQKKIAEILSTVDEAIEKVDESIARTERLKKGLMQELLTKGIGHKEFKDTEIGRIPKEWEVVKISNIADVKGGKRLPKGHNLADFRTPYPYIRVVDFKNMSIDLANVKFLLPETYKAIERYTISSNDVYISIAGSVGLAGLIPVELDGANLTENAAKLCNLRRVVKDFLAYVLNSLLVQKQIHGFVGKAQQPKLALFRIEKIKIPLPPLPEQQKIAEILSTVDKRLELLRNKKEKMEGIKKGLMNDLLTGKRRVKV